METRKRVSEVARELGVSEHWLRVAEKAGKIPKARRDLNGWRLYTQEDIASLKGLLLGNSRVQGPVISRTQRTLSRGPDGNRKGSRCDAPDEV